MTANVQEATDTATEQEAVLRGRALCALDHRRYPRLRLPDGRVVGPGLFAWAPVLREAGVDELNAIVALVKEKT